MILHHRLEVGHGSRQFLGFTIGQTAARERLGYQFVGREGLDELGESPDRILTAFCFSLRPGFVEERARLQLGWQLVDLHIVEAGGCAGVILLVEVKVGADQAGQIDEFVIGVGVGIFGDESRGEVGEILVIEEIEAVEFPIARLKGLITAGLALLNLQIHFHRPRIAFLHAVGIAHHEQNLRSCLTLWQDVGVLAVSADHAFVIAFGKQRLHDADEGDATIFSAGFRQLQGTFKERDRFLRLAHLRVQHRCFHGGVSDGGVVLAGAEQVLKNRQSLRLLVIGQQDRAKTEKGTFAVGVVGLDGHHGVECGELVRLVTEHLIGAGFVEGGCQAHLRQRGLCFAEGEHAR